MGGKNIKICRNKYFICGMFKYDKRNCFTDHLTQIAKFVIIYNENTAYKGTEVTNPNSPNIHLKVDNHWKPLVIQGDTKKGNFWKTQQKLKKSKKKNLLTEIEPLQLAF